MTVQELIKSRASECEDKIFLIVPENNEVLSFTGLQKRVEQISAQLDAMGTRVGDHVALLMENGQWTASLLLAIMASGRIAVPLDITADDSRLESVLEHCDANVLFASERQLERARTLGANLDRFINIIFASIEDGPQWESSVQDGTFSLPTIDADIPALLLYTSSKTDNIPNGVLLTHRNVMAGATNTVKAHALSSEDRALCILPLYYINALVVTVLAPLLSKGSVVMPHRFSTSAFWNLVREYQCTWFSLVPTIVDYLLASHEANPTNILNNPDYKQVRFGRSAAAALPTKSQRTFEEIFGIPLIETMGSTKTAAQILANPLPPFQGKEGSPGMAYRNEVIVVDKNGQEAPRGKIGELMVRGDNVMLKFYKNPAATQKFLSKDGWLRTGDLGYQDETGFFFITGRG